MRSILDAAMAEFAEHGHAGARMPAIARRAHVGKDLLFRHFRDKAALRVAVLRDAHEAVQALGTTSMAADPVEDMTAVVRGVQRLMTERPALSAILAAPEPPGDGAVPLLGGAPAGGWPLLDRIARILREGADAGAFRAGVDPLGIHLSILALTVRSPSRLRVLSVLHGRDLDGGPETDSWSDHVAAMVLASLRPRRVPGAGG